MVDLEDSDYLDKEYSDEVHDIIGRNPDWLIRWGITLLFMVFGLILFCSWFIDYPDIITTRIVLTTKNPPAKLVSYTNGKIVYLSKNNSKVSKQQIVAYIDNSADFNDIMYVDKNVLSKNVFFNNPDSLLEKINVRINLKLGELQDSYQKLIDALIEYRSFINLDSGVKQIESLNKKKIQYVDLNQQLDAQRDIQKQALDIIVNRYGLNEKLYKQKVMSDAEFENIKLNYLSAKKTYDMAENNIMNNKIAITQIESEIVSLNIAQREKSQVLRANIITYSKSFESAVNSWKQRYLITSTINGTFSIPKFMETDQNININDEIATVIPLDKNIYGQIMLATAKSGKIEIKEKVNIKFDNYPYNEYGMVKGEISSISAIPQNDLYTIQVLLPNGLKTSYHKELKFKQLLGGSAEIITKRRSVFSRIFHQFQYDQN